MKKELMPYYLSRALLSGLVGWILGASGALWMGVLAGVLVFAGFIWYAHSGRYLIDPSRPLTPLRRDARGKTIRDRAVVIAVGVGGGLYGIATLLGRIVPVPGNLGTWAALVGIVVYFAVSNWYYLRG